MGEKLAGKCGSEHILPWGTFPSNPPHPTLGLGKPWEGLGRKCVPHQSESNERRHLTQGISPAISWQLDSQDRICTVIGEMITPQWVQVVIIISGPAPIAQRGPTWNLEMKQRKY
jgi:hypothetical protein